MRHGVRAALGDTIKVRCGGFAGNHPFAIAQPLALELTILKRKASYTRSPISILYFVLRLVLFFFSSIFYFIFILSANRFMRARGASRPGLR